MSRCTRSAAERRRQQLPCRHRETPSSRPPNSVLHSRRILPPPGPILVSGTLITLHTNFVLHGVEGRPRLSFMSLPSRVLPLLPRSTLTKAMTGRSTRHHSELRYSVPDSAALKRGWRTNSRRWTRWLSHMPKRLMRLPATLCSQRRQWQPSRNSMRKVPLRNGADRERLLLVIMTVDTEEDWATR